MLAREQTNHRYSSSVLNGPISQLRYFGAYKAHLKGQPTKSGKIGLSPASINQALATLHSFFKWLTTKRYITYNPTLNVEKVPATPTETKDMKIAAVRQLADGLEHRGQRESLSIRDTAIFELLKHGLRATEVSNLNIGDYNGQAIQVSGAKWRSDGAGAAITEGSAITRELLGLVRPERLCYRFG